MDILQKDGNVLICGDSTDPQVWASIKEATGKDRFPLIYTDPPYGNIVKEVWDKATANDYMKWAKICQDHIVSGGSVFMWGGIGKYKDRPFLSFISSVENETEFRLKNLITWKKKRAYGKKDDYLFTREELAWLILGEKPNIFNIPLLDKIRGYDGYNAKYKAKSPFLRRTNVWDDITEIFKGKDHPTAKPSKLAEIVCLTHSNPGDYVVDIFSGGGSTGKAALDTGRKFVLVEKNTDYFDIAAKKLF